MPLLIALGVIWAIAKMLQSEEGRGTLRVMAVIVVGLLVLASAGAGTWAFGPKG